MEELLKIINDEKTALFFTLFIPTYAALLAVLLTRRKSRIYRNKSNIEKAYELLLKGNEQQTLNNKAIYLIYKREIALKYESFSYIDFLECFLLYVRQKDEDGLLTNRISEIIDPILEKEKAEKPFSNVKERERRILLAIEESAKKGELASINSNLVDMSIVIENNQKALDTARMTNYWTIPISIVGIMLTVFIWIWGSSLSDKDVQRISSQIYTSISDSLQTAKSDSLCVVK